MFCVGQTMKLYAIVEITSSKTVAVVASCWLTFTDENVTWPPSKQDQEARKRGKPQANWSSFEA